ncbi:MAG: sugar phosphate isomerase/epimerase, partial [Treponema sp.]|nr:sugar phosphate isomerase/epimerase [Treponema sp.]
MSRPVTLFTGQWADLSFDVMCAKAKSFGYDGLEIACWGDHLDLKKAALEPAYAKDRLDILAKHSLKTWAIGTHLVGQCVGDRWD